VLHRKDFHAVPFEQSRYLAEHIPKAKLVELPGADMVLVYETPELALDLIEEFLTGVRRNPTPTRVLGSRTGIRVRRLGWLVGVGGR
jgi:hypothetical protein